MFFKQETENQIYFFKDHFSSYVKDTLGKVIAKPVRRPYGIVVRENVVLMESLGFPWLKKPYFLNGVNKYARYFSIENQEGNQEKNQALKIIKTGF